MSTNTPVISLWHDNPTGITHEELNRNIRKNQIADINREASEGFNRIAASLTDINKAFIASVRRSTFGIDMIRAMNSGNISCLPEKALKYIASSAAIHHKTQDADTLKARLEVLRNDAVNIDVKARMAKANLKAPADHDPADHDYGYFFKYPQ